MDDVVREMEVAGRLVKTTYQKREQDWSTNLNEQEGLTGFLPGPTTGQGKAKQRNRSSIQRDSLRSSWARLGYRSPNWPRRIAERMLW